MKRWLLLLLITLGCGAVRSAPSVPAPAAPTIVVSQVETPRADAGGVEDASSSHEQETAAAWDSTDYLGPYGHVFRAWTDLPDEMRVKIPSSVFDAHLVIRLDVQLGCVPADRSKRPKKGYQWPSLTQRCIEGSNKTHALVTLTKSSIFDPAAWGPPKKDIAYSPLISVNINGDDGRTEIGLAPPIEECTGVMIVDAHWLALPKKGPVRLGLTEGGGHCHTL